MPDRNYPLAAEFLEPRMLLSAARPYLLNPPHTAAAAGFVTPRTAAIAAEPDDFVYQLQNVYLAAMGQTRFDLAVIDYSKDGSDAGRWSNKQIRHLRNSPGGSKTVLSYLSIGEAEDYRGYWKRNWDANRGGKPDKSAPGWIGPQNPDWPGNYKVKYWDPAWQQIVFRYVDQIINEGFNGVYLDIIDAYQYWGPGGESGLNRKTAEQEMVDFVKAIARHARHVDGAKGFLVYVQNAEELASHADYLAAVNGIGKEDTWYNDNTPNAPQDVADTLANLDLFNRAGKSVLTIDYVTRPNLVDDFYAKAVAKGYVPYVSDRDLDRLTINAGHQPD